MVGQLEIFHLIEAGGGGGGGVDGGVTYNCTLYIILLNKVFFVQLLLFVVELKSKQN